MAEEKMTVQHARDQAGPSIRQHAHESEDERLRFYGVREAVTSDSGDPRRMTESINRLDVVCAR
jgi:hypothetical protein